MGIIRNWIDGENRKAARFGKMLEERHVDTAALALDDHAASLRRAIERCRGCHVTGTCEAWLAQEQHTGEPTFCPNHELFTEYSRDSL